MHAIEPLNYHKQSVPTIVKIIFEDKVNYRYVGIVV